MKSPTSVALRLLWPMTMLACGPGTSQSQPVNGLSAARTRALATYEQTVPRDRVPRPITDLETLRDTMAVRSVDVATAIEVEINITHTRVDDLQVHVVCPGGMEVLLLEAGTAGPQEDLHETYPLDVCAGRPIGGLWQLFVTDTAEPNVGTLDSWTLRATTEEDDPACVNTHWVGIANRGNDGYICGGPAEPWGVQRLFGGHPGHDPLWWELGRFCSYRWEGEEPPDPSDLLLLQELIGPGDNELAQLSRDCLVVYPMTPPRGYAKEHAWRGLWSRFRNELGRATLPNREPPDPSMPPSKDPRLVIIDNARTRTHAEEPARHRDDSLEHGFAMVNFAHDLVCHVDEEAGYCPGAIATRQALGFDSYDPGARQPGPTDLGNMGLLEDLAEAVVQATYETDFATQHLVINLSVGWDGRFGGPEVPELMRPEVRGVLEAIEYASCQQALVVAAAGNHTVGPTYPGAWEQRPRPSLQRCSELEAVPQDEVFPTDDDYAPLVYATTGLKPPHYDEDADRWIWVPLDNMSEGAMAPLTAYGSAGVVELAHFPDEASAMLTGSSVATIAVSSAAMAVWYYRWDLTPWSVMDILRDGSEDLGFAPDFSMATAAQPTVRRVHISGVLEHACSGADAGCPPPAEPSPFSRRDEVPDFAGLPNEPDEPGPSEGVSCSTVGPPENGDPFVCPQNVFPSGHAQPWTLCQPGSDPCSTCPKLLSSVLLDIPAHHLANLRPEAVLTVGNITYQFDIGDGHKVIGFDFDAAGYRPGDHLSITFVQTNNVRVQSPLIRIE